ncbi:MAG: DnaJ domain-containing protein [Desulfuromonadaceae bacterium]|nr:DnaJ domain-containing protein [Desulfuromonadaceae bacterium]
MGLEVSPRASREVIELAYKAIAKKYHPDLNDTSKREFYNIKMTLINEARSVLTDTYKRTLYDNKYRNQHIKYTDQSQTNRSNTSSYSKPEPDQTSKSNPDHTAEKKETGHSSDPNVSKAKVATKKEGNAFEYFSIPLAIFLIMIVAIAVGLIVSSLFSGSRVYSTSTATSYAASNTTRHTTSNSTNQSPSETTKIPYSTNLASSIAPSDTAEYIKENIGSISDFSWTVNETGSITFDIDFRNNSPKTINSITIKIIILDQDKNILSSTDSGSTYAALLLPGPIEPSEIGGLGRHWKNVFTNKNAAICYFDNIEITYDDGSVYTIKARTTALFE